MSLGASAAAIVVLAIAILMVGAPAEASTCTLTTTVPTTNWTDTTKWTGCGGSFPGALAGDTAVVSLSGFTLNVNAVIPAGVILQMTGGGTNVDIPAGNALQIEASSSSTSSNTINVNGGQLGVGAGTVTWGGNLNHNTGTIALTGTLQNVNGQGTFTVNGGTIQGPGTFKIVSGSPVSFTGSGGGMTVNGAFVDTFGILTYSSNTGQSLSLNNGAHLKVQSGAQLSITGGDPIQYNGTGGSAIDVFSGGAMSKGTSVTTTQIDAAVNNGGSVTVTSGILNLYGGGTHSGAFSTATGGTTMGFDGTHAFAAGSTATGAGVFQLVGGNFNVNTTSGAPWAPQFFTQSGGTLAGTGTIRVTSQFVWSGGTQTSAGTTELQGTTSVLGGSVQLDFGRIMANSGTINYGPNGANFLGIDNGAHINNTGIFNLLNDQPINSFTPAASYIENSSTATFNKTGGTSSSISAGFDLLGQSMVVPGAGTTIQLLGGSSTSGKFGGTGATINLSAVGSTVDLAGSLFYKFDATATGLTVTGNGTLRLSSSAGLAITGGPISVTNFVQDDSSLLKTSAAGISVPSLGIYTWNGGTIDGLGGGGDLITVNGTGLLKIKGTSGAMTLQNFAHIKNNGGSIDFNPVSNLSVNNGAVINNAGGTFTFNNNSAFGILSDGINSPTFTNSGTVTKAANPNSQQIAAIFNNNTTLNILGGTLQLAGGGNNVGAIAITNAADRLEITSGTYNLSAGTAISGNGTLAVMNGATLGNNATPSFNNFEMNGSATVNGGVTGSLTINSSFDWNGGTLTGAGSLTTSPGVITDATALVGPITMADGFTFINNGTFNYNPTFNFNFNDNGGGGVNFSNNGIGVFDIKGNGTTAVIGSGNAFNNFGTVKKTAGAGGFTFTVQFANAGGMVDEQFGSNSTIAFNGAGSVMTGGTIQSSNAAGNIDFLNPPGSFSVNGGSFTGPGAINLKGGLLIVNSVQNFPPVFNLQGGQLSANQLINVPSGAAFNWNGGSISGSTGQLAIKSGGTMTIDTAATSLSMGLVPLVIDAGGNVNWNSGSNSLSFQAGASVTDNGTFTVSTNSSLTGTASFAVNGIFQHTVAGTLGVTLPLNVQSGGTIRSSGGSILALQGLAGVSHAGTFDAQAGSFIDFSAGTHQFNAGAGFSAGTGIYKINGATLNLNGVNVTAPNFGIASGSLVGSGNLDTTTNFTWTGGTMAGTGTTTVASGTASFTTGPLTLNRNLVLSGNTTMNAPSGLTVQTTSTVTNNANFSVQNGDVLCSACTTASFVNNGTIQKSAAGVTNWNVPITGSGILSTTAGNLNVQAAASFASATVNTSSINFSGSPITLGSLSGTTSPNVTVSGGATTVSGSTSLSGSAFLQVTGGTLTMNGAASTDVLTMSGGTIAGSGAFTVNGGSVWSGGSINGSSPITFNGGLNITGANGAMSLGRNLVNNNTLGYNPPNATNVLTLTSTTTITNNSAFNIIGGFDLANSGSATFNNTAAGTINRVSGPANAIIFGPTLSNAGSTNWSVGNTTFANGFSQTAGTTTVNAATISLPFPFLISGGTLFAKGTLNGDVQLSGSAIFNPGTSPGAVTILGNYTQASGNTMNVELNGTVAGTSYDQVIISGNATLAGTLNVTVGYTPANNDFYDVLSIGGTRSGDFTTKNLPALPGPGTLTATYIIGPPEKLRIQAVVPNPDLNISVSAPATVFHGQNATLTFAIGNSGSNPANSVVFNETLTNATLVSITSTGPCTTTPISCSLGTIPGGGSTSVVMQINAGTLGSITSNASVTHSVTDPTPANNSALSTITVTPASDFGILSVIAPATVNAGANLTDVVTVKNAGPDASVPTLSIGVSGGTIVSATGGGFTCSGTPTSQTCAGSSIALNGTAALNVVITAQTAPGNVVLTATTSSAADPNGANNSGTATTAIGNIADLSIVKTGPPTATVGSNITYNLAITNLGPSNANNVVVNDPTPARLSLVSVTGAGCSALPCTIATLTNGQTATVQATFNVLPGPPGSFFNTAGVTTDTLDLNNSNDFSSATTAIGCGGQGPAPISPAANTVVGVTATFSWGAVTGAIDYTVNVNVNGTPFILGPTTATSISSPLPDGAGFWNVSANFGGNCTAVPSANVPFTVCSGTAAPLLRLISEAVSGQTYRVEWDGIGGATGYEVDESTDINFATVTTTSLAGTGVNFQHTAFTPTAYYYRVRAFLPCAGHFGAYSPSVRIVITPVPAPNDPNPNVNVPAGSTQPVVQIVHIPGFPGGSFSFFATTDQPWFTVTPTAGILPPGGLDFTVIFNPALVPGFNGTFTGTIILSVTTSTSSSSGGIIANAETKVKAPVSISLVTPVSSTPKSGVPPANALIIPSVGHLNGINSVWRSDIRLANTGFQKVKYQLTFAPSGEDISKPVKQTTIEVDAGGTTALDDIVRNWYGVGSLGEGANGVLEIRPLNIANKGGAVQPNVDVAFVTAVSSRTYNVSAQGTLGQFIPAVPFASFIGKAAGSGLSTILGLQQIAQNADFRTNLGLVEGAGKPATVQVNVFDGGGNKVLAQTVNLAAGEQKQLNGFLSQNGVTLADGRIEVQVTGGDGRITAYASRIDNASGDPLLVTGVPLRAQSATHYVVPGVAKLNTGFANWQSDVRMFNAGSDPVTSTVTYYPQNNSGSPSVTSVTVNAGETKQLDNVLQTLFGLTDTGGALHVNTPTDTNFVISARTFNQTSKGSFGQYIPAVTALDAVGAGGRALQILQAEESVRYRTNVGITEVTGKPAVVELSIFLPDSKTSAKTEFPLGANEFKQFNVIRDIGLDNVYNARIQVRVLSGDGKVSAYGSVIDMQTQDGTYVPAQ
ncbi:MAG: hypothetical protein AABO58_04115 [Acidobacteriota bacterium]